MASGNGVTVSRDKADDEIVLSVRDVTVAIDETPVGVFIELEGSEHGILATTAALGRRPEDFVLDSYRGLFLKHREAFGLTGTDMVFGR